MFVFWQIMVMEDLLYNFICTGYTHNNFFYIHQTLLQQSQQNFLFSRKQSVVRLENF